MNIYKLKEITAIGNAIESAEKALDYAKTEGNDYCTENLIAALEKLNQALEYANSCDRGE